MNTKSFEFLTLDKTEAVKNDREPEYAFGFDVAFRRASVDVSHERQVYTILEYFGDVGGLNDAMTLLFMPILSIWTPSLLTRKMLN